MDPRRATCRYRLPVLVCGLLTAPLVAGCGSTSAEWTAASLDAITEERPGVPLVLPASLPDGYAFLGPGFFMRDGSGVILRSVDFTRGDPDLVVDVCVEPEDRDGCVSSNGRQIDRSTDQYAIVVRFVQATEVPAEDLEFWRQVPLVLHPAEADWLADD